MAETACTFTGCQKSVKYRGLCSGHAEQRRLGRDLTPLRPRRAKGTSAPCSYSNCAKPQAGLGLCWGHYDQQRRGQELRPLLSRRPSGTHSQRDSAGRKCCHICGEWKSEDYFFAASRKADGLDSRCRDCSRWETLLRQYGLSRAAYQSLLDTQAGACAICLDVPVSGFHVDHDHSCCSAPSQSCGECVRGLLCGTCNAGIGLLRDNADHLRRAIAYLEAAA